MAIADELALSAAMVQVLERSREFIDRHSESWYTPGQELLREIDSVLTWARTGKRPEKGRGMPWQ